MYMHVLIKNIYLDTCKYLHIHTILTYIQDTYIVQKYIFVCIFDQIHHPIFKYLRIHTTWFTDVLLP